MAGPDPLPDPPADRLPTLAGRRLALRWLTADDLDSLLEIFGDPQVLRYLSVSPLRDRAGAAEFLARVETGFHERTRFQWGLARADDGRVIGTCVLSDINWPHERAEIGFALAAAHWRQGWMTEALPLLCRHAFDELGLHRLVADVDPRNAPSLRLLDKLGFRREGYLRQTYLQAGERQDSVLLGLLGEEWRSR